MSDDQYTEQDPTTQHEQPDTQGEKLDPPGNKDSVTAAMGEQPNHGEDSYRGADKLRTRAGSSPEGTRELAALSRSRSHEKVPTS